MVARVCQVSVLFANVIIIHSFTSTYQNFIFFQNSTMPTLMIRYPNRPLPPYHAPFRQASGIWKCSFHQCPMWKRQSLALLSSKFLHHVIVLVLLFKRAFAAATTSAGTAQLNIVLPKTSRLRSLSIFLLPFFNK